MSRHTKHLVSFISNMNRMFLTCHFRQPGLNDGESMRAPASVVKMYSTLSLVCRRDRCGNSFAGYVINGTFLNSFCTGSGAVKKEDLAAGRCNIFRRFSWASVLSMISSAARREECTAQMCIRLEFVSEFWTLMSINVHSPEL